MHHATEGRCRGEWVLGHRYEVSLETARGKRYDATTTTTTMERNEVRCHIAHWAMVCGFEVSRAYDTRMPSVCVCGGVCGKGCENCRGFAMEGNVVSEENLFSPLPILNYVAPCSTSCHQLQREKVFCTSHHHPSPSLPRQGNDMNDDDDDDGKTHHHSDSAALQMQARHR